MTDKAIERAVRRARREAGGGIDVLAILIFIASAFAAFQAGPAVGKKVEEIKTEIGRVMGSPPPSSFPR